MKKLFFEGVIVSHELSAWKINLRDDWERTADLAKASSL